MLHRSSLLLFGSLLTTVPCFAQATSLRLVLPDGQGQMTVPLDGGWQPASLTLDRTGDHLTLQMHGQQEGTELTVVLFHHESVGSSPASCREDVLQPVLHGPNSRVASRTLVRGDVASDAGAPLATATYATPMAGDEETNLEGVQFLQQHTFAFYGDTHICAELHFSEVLPKGRAPHDFSSDLQGLNASGSYVANSYDDAQIGSVFYRLMRNYAGAATYYQRAVDLMPPPKTPQSLAFFRFVNDQLAISYGILGDLARSRAVNEAGIAKDPDYPIYYYNLACADAEAGNAVAAKQHLQQAFARRANTLRGERMPDPTQDDSLQKLRDNADFWAFVQSLPKS